MACNNGRVHISDRSLRRRDVLRWYKSTVSPTVFVSLEACSYKLEAQKIISPLRSEDSYKLFGAYTLFLS
ncbi:hypothetical protein QWZ13_07490 [Reinekea marina]|uniref:hypothetical protein n=1 Tax=Reinekea marina TaxID=1310421 RepID=UPI0025B509CC|nr:hypothetical protein [Reinekea marina]MDN3648752.1 hypothetical protein [Reinekea marina]